MATLINLRQIEVFTAIMRTGSVTKAAKTLNVSQPSVSKVLKHTEARLGFPLFKRISGKLYPTPEAEILYSESARIDEDVDHLSQLAFELRDGGVGRVRFGCPPSLATHVLPMGIEAFRARCPDIDLPDKGAVRCVVAIDPAMIPEAPPVGVELSGPTNWAFQPASTPFGLSYFVSDAEVVLKLTNRSSKRTSCWPVIRINGQQIHADQSVCPRLPLVLEPGQTLSAPLVLNLRRVSPGPHLVQVHFLEDEMTRVHRFPVTLSHASYTSARIEE